MKLYHSFRMVNSSNNDIEVYILKNNNLDTIRNNANNNYSGYYQKKTIKTNSEEDLYEGVVVDDFVLFGIINVSNVNCYAIFKNPCNYYSIIDGHKFAKVHFSADKAYISNTDYIYKDDSASLLVEIHP